MGGLFGGDSTPAVVEPPETPTRSDADVRAEALAERQRRARAQGRASTIKTSPQGVASEDAAPTKQLLGNA